MRRCRRGCGFTVRAKTEEKERSILIKHEKECEKLQKADKEIFNKINKIITKGEG